MSECIYCDSELQMDSRMILCIEEHDITSTPSNLDTKLFIGWNSNEHEFFVRGKRRDSGDTTYVPYAFHSVIMTCIVDFIEFIIDDGADVSVILYNYNNIDFENYDDMTYEYFEEQQDKNYEITGYNNHKLNRELLKKMLGMIKNMYN